MKKFFLFLMVIGFCFAGEISHHNHHIKHCDLSVKEQLTDNPSKEVMDLMHLPMMCEKWIESGNAEIDFLENMIPHHQGAILSSKALLKYSQNPKVIEFATAIIQSQEKEIAHFKLVLKDLKKTKTKNYKQFAKKAKQDMHLMEEAMQKVKESGDVNKDFIASMIPHHQGAIIASRQILEWSKNPEIIQIAKAIIQDQEKEIQAFKEFLENPKE